MNFAPETTGIAPYTTAIARGLAERGLAVRVVTAMPHYPEWRFRKGYRGWSHRDSNFPFSVLRLRHYVPAKPEGLRRLLSELSFGARVFFTRLGQPTNFLLVSPALFATSAALLRIRLSARGTPAYVWVQDLYALGVTETGAGGRLVAAVMRWVESRTLRAADGVIVIHPRFAKYVTQQLGIRADDVRVIRNWTHLDSFPSTDRRQVRERHGWGPDETIVLHSGNMGLKQGLENVVAAARLADQRASPVRFVLMGAGSQKDALVAAAQGVDRLQFIAPLADEDFQHSLAAADILLVNERPGVSEMAAPSKLTSYFSAGRPIVAATDLEGVTAEEIASAGAGVIVPAGSPEDLLDTCLSLALDKKRASAYGNAGARYRHAVLAEDAAVDAFMQMVGTKGDGTLLDS